ncbi:Ecm11p [Saccharomyces paradoxus]|uniref:Ecm11p n=1 Tax=Saccharomyces paradoxus TaxID=27291 RepID=A0A8B8UPG4_SACPA|nr:Ecm11 [Saccharomyces paradoxus]QHS72627.1 Ecm11 [Saccharomyces paradoxus]
MTVIKTEPTTEVALYSPPPKESLSKDDAQKRKQNNKQPSNINSRSGSNKHKVTTKAPEKKINNTDKQDLSAFLLNPSLIVKPSESKKKENTVAYDAPNVKTEYTGFQPLTPISKKRALKEKSTSDKYGNFDLSKDENSHTQKKPKKLSSVTDINTSEYKLPLNRENTSSPAKEKSQEPTENPGAYQKTKNYLFDKPDLLDTCLQDYSSMLPPNIAEEDQEYFVGVADSTLEEWTNKGQEILDQQFQLYQEIIKKRIELSYKFKGIISVINDRADALEEQGQQLEGKIKKVKSLANEILNII